MISVNKIFLFVESCCNKGAGISRATGIKKIFPKVNDAFVSVSSKIKRGKKSAGCAAAQDILEKDAGLYFYDKFT